MNITRNLLHEWYHGGARTAADRFETDRVSG